MVKGEAAANENLLGRVCMGLPARRGKRFAGFDQLSGNVATLHLSAERIAFIPETRQ